MKKRIGLFAASFVIAMLAAFAFAVPSSNVSATGGGCHEPSRNSCHRSYDRCVKQAKNPGWVNQCRKALQTCLKACGC
jgi:hypothetical protein